MLPPTFAATCIILFPFYDRMQNAPPAAADDDAVIQKYFGENKQPFAYTFHLFLAGNLDCSCRGYYFTRVLVIAQSQLEWSIEAKISFSVAIICEADRPLSTSDNAIL